MSRDPPPNSLRATKFAISVPAETMLEVGRAAKRLGVTRSRYISMVLARVARRQRDATISKQVDEALADISEQDLRFVEYFQGARRDEGTERQFNKVTSFGCRPQRGGGP